MSIFRRLELKLFMDRRRCYIFATVSILLLISAPFSSCGWFFSSTDKTSDHESKKLYGTKTHQASEFSMESFNDPKGVVLIENARTKMLVPNSCWQAAYQSVFNGCSKTVADEELRSRLAWHLSDCFQQHTGRPPFPRCRENSPMQPCLKNLDLDAHKIYLEYFLETNSICHQLQTEAFRMQTERLVNELKTSAEYAEIKLEEIEQHGVRLLQDARQVQDSLASIDLGTQQVAEASRQVEDRVNSVLKHSELVYEQSRGIADSQAELAKGQARMNEGLVQGMVVLHDSYTNLGAQITDLRYEAVEIEKEIGRVGDAMFLKMGSLQSKAEDIGEMAGSSLDKQKQLLVRQSEALDGINFLTKFQSQALEESRASLEKLAEFGHKQQEELLKKQKELYQSHDHLIENSRLLLEAQKAFESKQASMFVAIDKLFALHSAMVFESRVIVAFLVYSIAIFIIYMLTSVKQAYNVRHRLYLGLCFTLCVEVTILWYVTANVERQGKMIRMARSFFGVLASVQYIYNIFTYRDYEVLNHTMLMMLTEKVNGMMMEGKTAKGMLLDMDDSDSEVEWSTWVDTDLSENVDVLEDPDYTLPQLEHETASTCSKRYNLRQRY